MNCKIEFNMDNAAFCDIPEVEAARILKDAAEKIEAGQQEFSLMDFNGNVVGKVEITQ